MPTDYDVRAWRAAGYAPRSPLLTPEHEDDCSHEDARGYSLVSRHSAVFTARENEPVVAYRDGFETLVEGDGSQWLEPTDGWQSYVVYPQA